MHGCEAVQWSMVSHPGIMSIKKTDCSPSSHQLSLAPRLGMDTSQIQVEKMLSVGRREAVGNNLIFLVLDEESRKASKHSLCDPPDSG